MFNRDHFIFILFILFCLGIILGIYELIPITMIIISIFILFFLLCVFLFLKKSPIVILLLLIFLITIVFSYENKIQEPQEIKDIYGLKIVVVGKIDGSIELRNNYQRYKVQTVQINDMPIEVGILVYEEFPTSCKTGDLIKLEGFFQSADDFVTDSGRVFPYKKYLLTNKIFGIIFAPNPECSDGDIEFFTALAILKEKTLAQIYKLYPKNEAGLLAGILLGEKTSLDSDLTKAFIFTGLIHIVVLSGYNITVVAESIRRFIAFFSKKYSMLIAALFIILFVLFTGADVPAVRAGSLAVITLLAKFFKKETEAIKLLILIALVLILINPTILLFDVSFHMSFLATFGILLYTNRITKFMTRVSNKFQLREIIASTIAVNIFLLPYLIYRVGLISIVGILANILVLPVLPLTMFFGFITILISFLYFPLAYLVLPVSYALLLYIINIANIFSSIPFAAVNVFEIHFIVMIMCYVFLFSPLYKTFNLHKLFS